jgi:PIN domain nuclease of toxin-antitoxin system
LSDIVTKSLKDAVISGVNYSEVVEKTIQRGDDGEPVTAFVHNLSIGIIPFDELQADVSASFYPETAKSKKRLRPPCGAGSPPSPACSST